MEYRAEGPTRITRTTVEAGWKRRAPGVTLVIHDERCAGLQLVITERRVSWRYRFRPRGINPATGNRFAQQTVTIGSSEQFAPEAARQQAEALRQRVRAGGDPAADLRAAHTARAAALERTAGKLLDAYAAELPQRAKRRGKPGPPSPRHVQNEVAHARAALAAMKVLDRPIEQIGTAELRGLLRLDASRPATARARFGALSRFLDWALSEEAITINPTAAIAAKDRPRPAASRSRVVSLPDLGRLWRAADQLAPMQRDLARLLIALPCRVGEAAHLEWQHLDFAGKVWNQPSTLTKNAEAHALHLHPLAFALLDRRHAEAQHPKAGLVFPGERSGKPFQGFKALKKRLSELAGVQDWTWHDFRRSFASSLGESGASEVSVDMVLNHASSASRGGVLGVYQRSSRRPEQAAVMQQWARMLQAAIDGRPQDQAEVVPLTHGRRR